MRAFLTGAFLRMNSGPLIERFRRGEGALLVVNLALVAFLQPPLGEALGYAVLSTAVLTAAYAVNDWKDAEDDRRNPKKNQQLVEALARFRRPFGIWLGILHLGLPLLALAWLGGHASLAVLAMLGVNSLYSFWLKGLPIADLLIVGVWGAFYAAIVPAPWRIYVFIGAMTAIMHIFQIQQDRDVDARNEVSTTAVRIPQLATVAFAVFCASIFFALLEPLGPIWASTAAIPLILRLGIGDTGHAWMASRVYCGVALLALLRTLHEHP
ncbi:MAG: UbiA family prenyltransferase [Myxococcota bacterium]|nr:UbiA family prenyltransferase [Myxococcota bacterium]